VTILHRQAHAKSTNNACIQPAMNPVNPKKLLNTKWTSVKPVNREKHFLVTEVEYDEDGRVIHCLIEAVLTRRSRTIDWRSLKDSDQWFSGWV